MPKPLLFTFINESFSLLFIGAEFRNEKSLEPEDFLEISLELLYEAFDFRFFPPMAI